MISKKYLIMEYKCINEGYDCFVRKFEDEDWRNIYGKRI